MGISCYFCSMVSILNTLVSDEVFTECFCCDLQKCKGFYRITKKIEKAKQEGIQQDKILSEQEGFEMAANIVYAVLRSNGKPVKFDEALALVPPDLEELKEVIQGFQEEYEKYSKKKAAKQMTTPAQ